MRIRNRVTAAFFAVSAASAPALVQGLNLTFLDQAPMRFFNEEDLKLLSDASDQALDEATDGESVDWSNESTGNSGSLTPVNSFTRQGKDCRRLEVISQATKATRGSARTLVDFCKVGGAWKILTIVR
jgi:surface antigen